MFDFNKEIKLVDFGTSKLIWGNSLSAEYTGSKSFQNTTTTGFQGTVLYMAPEMAKKWKRGEEYSYDPFASDLWSLGVTICQCLTNDIPFTPKDKSVKSFLECIWDPNTVPKLNEWSKKSAKIKNIILQLLSLKSEDWGTASEILNKVGGCPDFR